MTEKKAEIPLKDMTAAMDMNKKDFYSKLTPEQQKAFVPWLAMRFLSSAEGRFADHYLLMTNDLVNHEFTSLTKHPELQWMLMALCGIGAAVFHPWIPPGNNKGKNKIQTALSKVYPKLKADELELMEKIHTLAEIKTLFKDSGYSDKEIKELL